MAIFSEAVVTKFYLIIGAVGLILRLILMPLTVHPDLWALFFSGHLFAFNGVINIYDYLASVQSNADLARNYGTNFFTYPPLAYFTFGFFSLLLKPFTDGGFMSFVTAYYPHIYENPQILKEIFIFKFPYLVFDLLTAFFLTKLFSNEKEKKLSFAFWLLNPISLYTTFMIGQFDIFPVFFVVLALYFANQKRENLSVLMVGVGGAFKMFPLLFLPFFIFFFEKTILGRLKLAVLGLLPYLLTVLPFIGSPAFRQASLFSSQSQKMLFMNLPVSGAEGVYVFVFVLFFAFLYSAFNYRKFEVWQYCLLVMLLFFSVTHFHPQWMLWLTPLVIIELVLNKFKNIWIWLVVFLAWMGITFTFEPSLNFGLFVPVFPDLLKAKGLSEIISSYYDVFQLKSLLRSVLAASSLYLIYALFQKHQSSKI